MTDQPSSRRNALSSEQIAFLIESGAFTAERFAEVSRRVARGDLEARERKAREDTIEASLNPGQAAGRLGLTLAEVRRLTAERQLYAFNARDEMLYPIWQFTGAPAGPVLPGLAAVIAAFPAGMHPATIRGFMHTPQRLTVLDGVRVTPVDWLRQAGDPRVLVDVLEGFLLG